MTVHYDDPLELPREADAFARRMCGAACWVPNRLAAQELGEMPLFEPNAAGLSRQELADRTFWWSHGERRVRSPQGWTVVRLFPDRGYDLLGHLALVQSWCASLAGPDGPMRPCLLHHARTEYGIEDYSDELTPDGYDGIAWNYLPFAGSPAQLVEARLDWQPQTGSKRRVPMSIARLRAAFLPRDSEE